MADWKSLLADQGPKIALALMAAKQHGPQAAAALMQGIQQSAMRKQQMAQQQEQETFQRDRVAFDQQNALDDNARADDNARMDRVQKALALIQSNAQNLGETATDPEQAQAQLGQTAQSAAGLYGVDPQQLSGMVPNIRPTITKRQQKQAMDRYTALQKIYGEEAVASDAITDNGEQFKGMKPSQILALAQMGAQAAEGAPAKPYVRPTAATQPPTPGTFEDFVVRKYGANPTPEQILEGRRLYQQSDDRQPATRPDGLTPNASLDGTLRLRDRFIKETQAAAAVNTQFMLMKSSLEAVRRGAAAPGSQGVLVTFQKILDPTSVVRESEYARSASGLSLLSRMEGAWDKIEHGGAGVPVHDLEQFVKLAEQFVRNQAQAAEATKAQIEGIATQHGLKHENITRDLGLPKDAAAGDEPDPLGLFK